MILSLLFALCLNPLLGFQDTRQNDNMEKQGPYQEEWKVIDSLEAQGLPRSALDKVEELYQRAKKEDQPAQLVKTIIYKNKYQAQLEEEGMVKVIERMKEEAQEADFPVKPILHSLLGELYQQYIDQNYWKLMGRTAVSGYLPEGLQTWSLDQLLEAASGHYMKSVRNAETFDIPIEEFDAITRKGSPGVDELRPTLYDFLVFRAIEHFSNERSYLTQPAYRFQLDQPDAFGPADEFVLLEWNTRDTNSYKYLALVLFQDLLGRRLAADNATALADADLRRLSFVRQQSVLSQKDSLYLGGLQSVEQRHAGQPPVAEVWYKMAELYAEQGNNYDPGVNEAHKWKRKEALELCNKAIEEYPESYGARQCESLKGQLLRKSLEMAVEEVNLPGQPFLAAVRYRNLPAAHFRILSLSEEERLGLRNMRMEEAYAALAAKKPLRSWKTTLPDDGDLQEHAVELAVDKLPFGFYAILMADNDDFAYSENAVGYLFTAVSEISYLNRRGEKTANEFLLLHRETGAPLEGVKAEFFTTRYNRQKKEQERVRLGEALSDKDGFVYPKLAKDTYFQVRFSKGKDVLFFEDGYSNYSSTQRQRRNTETHFFMDRAIYRPGQTIYYKAIVMEREEESRVPEILSGHKFTVTFYDVNGQEVAKQELTTNEYGTANGSFTAPQGGMLGQMRLFSDAGQSTEYFSVEEYKRPKFEVTMNPLEGSPALGDTITIKGKAMAFAGSSIDGAEVKYRVVREVQYPWFPWWGYGRKILPPRSGESQEITTGVITTENDGSFEFSFVARPDLSVDKADKPEFIFTAYVDVTDITGETHSNSKTISLAYLGLKADATLPESIDRAAGMATIGITTQNLDGEPQPAKGALSIHQLEAPKRTFIERYWEKPDRHILEEKEFLNKFPHFAFKDENEKPNWPQKEEVLRQPFDTGEEDSLMANISGWPVGHYLLKLETKDENGNLIELRKFFTIYDSEKELLPEGTLAWKKQPKGNTHQPGDEAKILLGTRSEGLHLLYELERQRNIEIRSWREVKQWSDISHQVTENDRGNIFAHLTFVRFNRAFTWEESILVPWKNKELKIEYSTFRDKLKPGQEEAWQLKVSGPGNEQLAAEMVATLYDASLDQFRPNSWSFSPFPSYYRARSWQSRHFNSAASNNSHYYPIRMVGPQRTYRSLNWFNFNYGMAYEYAAGGVMLRSSRHMEVAATAAPAEDEEMALTAKMADSADSSEAPPAPSPEQPEAVQKPTAPPVRRNLKETVFFFPELRTDKDGNVIIRFTMNEALTRWKFLALAHTPSLQNAISQKEVVTQKELMVMPNPPRFLREGDEIEFTAKVSNLTEEKMAGEAELMLFDAFSMEPIDEAFGNTSATLAFEAEGGQSAALSWRLKIPKGEVLAVTHRVVARAGNFSDGEESTLPVLTNQTLVTETMPMPVKGGETETFDFEAMAKAKQSTTLQHHNFALEFTSNPAWYAVKGLPYLMEFPYECTEQIFARYYANSLAASVANSKPAIQQVFEQWKNSNALISELQKNEELKTALLEETPWVMQAESEAAQRKQIGLLFDLNRMSYEQDKALSQLVERQSSAGGFSWFPGGQDSWYITQYILEGLGRLRAMGVRSIEPNTQAWQLAQNAAGFIDRELTEHYEDLLYQVEKGRAKLEEDNLSSIVIHYLYTRSLFQDMELEGKAREAQQYYLGQIEKYWLNKGLYQEGLMAVALQKYGKDKAAEKVVRSLRERALYDEEQGMYWKYNTGYFWHQAPIETHAMMIETFAEVAKDAEAVEQLKIWLLKNKQTNHWKTTKATANAVYALLNFGENWLEGTQLAEVSFPRLDEESFQPELIQARQFAEAGTGYFKASWDGDKLSQDFSRIRVENPNKGIAWGAAYWQYFEELDKVEVFRETPLTLHKQLFKETVGEEGPELSLVSPENPLEPGDKLVVRIGLRVDRDMEYVHLKDMRASGLEPMNVFSQYKWQGGLGYYESTRDLATHFFISYLPKGTYVFEYPLRVVHRGDFSNGISSIQCMYAPEFTSHSEGVRVTVK